MRSLKDKLPLDKITRNKGKKGAPLDNYIVALDIGTEFVKALIGRITPEGAEIVGIGRAHQELSDMQAGAVADIAGVVQNCDKALSAAEQQAGVSVRTTVIGIAGELVKGTTTAVIFRRKEANKELDVIEMERIIGMVQERAETKARQELAWELGGKDVEVRLVNSALVRIEIDGYPVTNPVGFKGREVRVELYTAFAPMIHIGALERVAKELDLDLLAVAAEPFAVARSVIGDDASATMSAILVDVGGGTTDIAIVNEGGVEGTKMFGIGGRAFTKAIARELDIEFPEAEAQKLSLGTNRVATEMLPAIQNATSKTISVWLNGIELALSEFNRLDHLPNRILLCGGGSSLQMLVDQLSQSDWYRHSAFTKKPVVQHIHPDEVVGITDSTGGVSDHTYITALGLMRVGIDTLGSSAGDAPSIRDRLNNILKV